MVMKKPELLINLGGIIGEGICWDENTQMLYWIDLLVNQIYAYDMNKKSLNIIDVGQNTGCVAVREKGGLVAGLQHGIFFVDIETGELTPVIDPESDKPDNRFNDGECDCMGRLWAGTMSKKLDSGSGDNTPAGALYCIDTDLSVTKKIPKATISNGIGYSPDNSIMYYIDSPTRNVDAFDFDKETGEITNRRAVVHVDEETGMPDGLTVDADGNLWVGMWGRRSCCQIRSGYSRDAREDRSTRTVRHDDGVRRQGHGRDVHKHGKDEHRPQQIS